MAEPKKTPLLDDLPDIKTLSHALHASCGSIYQAEAKLWSQEDLLNLDIIPRNDLKVLNECLNRLAGQSLLKVLQKDGRAYWKFVKEDDATSVRNLTSDEQIIYGHIATAGRDGIWQKAIRTRSNLHEAVCKRCLKTLESKRLIKSFHNTKQPKSKFYLLFNLQPSDNVTGGLFFQNGERDNEFLYHVSQLAERFIQRKSWCRSAAKDVAKRRPDQLPKEEAEAIRAEGLDDRKPPTKWLPMPPSYDGYPTLSEITKDINKSGLFTVTMKEVEVEKVIDLLCWDGRIERIRDGTAYKTILSAPASSEAGRDTDRGEAPCLRCPVFDFCDESGPVNARSCKYFADWLAL